MFSGRKDNQIKFRGYRIEPEEIEYALNKVPDIFESCVLLKVFSKDSSSLIAYYSSANIIEEKIIVEVIGHYPSAHRRGGGMRIHFNEIRFDLGHCIVMRGAEPAVPEPRGRQQSWRQVYFTGIVLIIF